MSSPPQVHPAPALPLAVREPRPWTWPGVMLRAADYAALTKPRLSLLVLVATAAVQALLFRDGAATVIAAGAGVAAGLAIGAARDSRIIRRWEAENGRLYTGRQSDVERKRRLYVEDPAAAPLDAS